MTKDSWKVEMVPLTCSMLKKYGIEETNMNMVVEVDVAAVPYYMESMVMMLGLGKKAVMKWRYSCVW